MVLARAPRVNGGALTHGSSPARLTSWLHSAQRGALPVSTPRSGEEAGWNA
jgi:hypothetical protein